MERVYNIILVDDEDEIRGRIASKISEDLGFKIVGSAGTGYDALDLLEEQDVDVVLTDIKMPFIDGIELTRIIRRDYPMIKVAFITGYDEFLYAQEAINLNVNSYMMKPITSKQINQFLSKLKTDLDKEYEQMQDIMIMKEKYEELLPIIGDSYLSSLINMDNVTDSSKEQLKLYGIDVEGHKNFTTCLVQIKDSSKTLKENEQRKVNTNEMFKKVFMKADFKHSLLVADGIVFIFSFDDYDKSHVDELLHELCESTKEYIDTELLVGVSSVYSDFVDFPKSYEKARRAMGYATMDDFNNVVYEEELLQLKVKQSFISIRDFSTYDTLIQYGSKEQIIEKTNELIERAKDTQSFNREFVVIDLASLIINLADHASVSINDILDVELIDYFNKYNNYEGMLRGFLDIIFKICEFDSRSQINYNEQMIKDTISYIENNYTDTELSLEQICDEFNISISHMSTMFKKNSGYTFSKYLIKVRLDKAKQLLQTTSLKIADIASQVGYSDVYYFSHSFKKVVGVSPRDYRNEETIPKH